MARRIWACKQRRTAPLPPAPGARGAHHGQEAALTLPGCSLGRTKSRPKQALRGSRAKTPWASGKPVARPPGATRAARRTRASPDPPAFVDMPIMLFFFFQKLMSF